MIQAMRQGDSFKLLATSREELKVELCHCLTGAYSANTQQRFLFITSSKERKRLAADITLSLRDMGMVERVAPIFRDVWLKGQGEGELPAIQFRTYHDYFGLITSGVRCFIDYDSVPAERVKFIVSSALPKEGVAVTIHTVNRPVTAGDGINKVFV